MGAAFAAGVVDPSAELLAVLGGCALLFFAGLADDVFHLRPATKLAAQFGAAGIALAGGLRAEIFSNDVLALGLAFLWLVGLTNAFNLLDNMDGLAASMAAIACAYFAVAAVMPLDNNEATLALSLAVCFACAGFLPFNLRLRRPAAVFMGDSGSQVLGFALAALGLLGSWKEAGTTVATLVLPLLVLAVPILDTALVTFVRLLEGRPVSQGGKDHTSHRLVYRGLSEKRAVILLAVIAAALGATSLGYNVLANPYVTLVGVLHLCGAAPVRHVPRRVGPSRRRRTACSSTGGCCRWPWTQPDRRLLCRLRRRREGAGRRRSAARSPSASSSSRAIAFVALRIYRAVWRYAGARDVTAIVIAVCSGGRSGFLELFGTRDLPAHLRSRRADRRHDRASATAARAVPLIAAEGGST